jgi:hypothetical protein
MSALPQLSLKALATVGRSAAVLALIFWISFIEIFIYLAHTRPRSIDVATGRVYSINNHGSIVFLTRAENIFLYAFACVAGALIVVAAVCYNRTRAGNSESLRK